MATYSKLERRIAKTLDLSPAMLLTLLRAKANGGVARGPGMGYESIACRRPLREHGLLDDNDRLTEAGLEMVERARKLGF